MSVFVTAVLAAPAALDAHSIAGTSPQQIMQQTLAGLDAPVHRLDALADLPGRLDAWRQAGVERVLLLRADRPLLSGETLRALLDAHAARSAVWLALRPVGNTIPAGCASVPWLRTLLESAGPPHTLEEIHEGAGALTIEPLEPGECLALDSLPAVAEAERILRQRINLRWMLAGVEIVDPAATYIHATVSVQPGTVILPNTHLWGDTRIGAGCRIGPNSIVRDSQIGDRCAITASVVEQAVMEDESNIGPFGHLRKGAHLCHGAHMGNFGEIKNSTLGPNSKMGHFSYLGDATIGADVNIGAGTITCNYDGVNKHPTIVEDGAFIGSDSMLVAPVRIGRNARIGAGSVVTHDVPAGAVAYGVPARVVRTQAQEEEEEGDCSGPSQ